MHESNSDPRATLSSFAAPLLLTNLPAPPPPTTTIASSPLPPPRTIPILLPPSGAFSVVFLGTHVESGDKVAIKKIRKRTRATQSLHQEKKQLKVLQNEVNIMRKIMEDIKHPNLILMRDVFEDHGALSTSHFPFPTPFILHPHPTFTLHSFYTHPTFILHPPYIHPSLTLHSPNHTPTLRPCPCVRTCVYMCADFLYLVLEVLAGGELFDRIVDRGHYTEEDASRLTAKLMDALKVTHPL
jgi:serine/threonine protein kinase